MKVFGFERIESPKFDFEVIWLKLGSSMLLHLIERDPTVMLPEGPWSAVASVADPKNLPRGHHVCFYVPKFDSFVQRVKVHTLVSLLCFVQLVDLISLFFAWASMCLLWCDSGF